MTIRSKGAPGASSLTTSKRHTSRLSVAMPRIRSTLMSDAITLPGAHPFRKPLRERAVARADFQAAPAFHHTDALEVTATRGVEHVRHHAQTLGLAFELVLPDVGGHVEIPSRSSN